MVHDHQVAGPECRRQDAFDIALKAPGIHGTLEQPRRVDPVMAQGRDERHRVPVAVGDLGAQPDAARRSAA